MTEKESKEEFRPFYLLALDKTYREDQQAEDWADAARTIAVKIAAKAGVQAPATAAAAPAEALTPEGVSDSRFGPAFAGGDDDALQKILFAAQQIVLGREGGAMEEQIAPVMAELFAAIKELQVKHTARAEAIKNAAAP